ncbi:MAG: hemolysin family protein [Bacilli bacterium]
MNSRYSSPVPACILTLCARYDGKKIGEDVGIATHEVFNFLWAIVLIALNGYFVAAEFAIVRARRTRIEQYVQQGSRIAKHAMDVITKIDGYLSATQLGITLASLGLGWTAQRSIAPLLVSLFAQVGGVSLDVLEFVAALAAFILVTFLQIVFGELAPKSLAISRAETWLMASALPLKAFYGVMYPAIWVLNKTAGGVLRLARVRPVTPGELAHSEEELRMLVAQSHESGVIDETERELFNNVFAFADRVAREIMVPRTDMVCLFTDQTIEECLVEVQQDRHTRFPLCEGDKDHVIGIIHSKDLFSVALRLTVAEASIRTLARKAVSVPEAMGIDDVLKVLQKERSSLAIVIDEYGGTAGMVSLEDVIEELVGEIQDEFDEERPPIEELNGFLSIDARMLIEEFNELFDLSLSDEDVDTVGGWVYAQLTEPLRVELEVEHDGARFVVAEIDNLRITRVHVYPPLQNAVESVDDMDRRRLAE